MGCPEKVSARQEIKRTDRTGILSGAGKNVAGFDTKPEKNGNIYESSRKKGGYESFQLSAPDQVPQRKI